MAEEPTSPKEPEKPSEEGEKAVEEKAKELEGQQ